MRICICLAVVLYLVTPAWADTLTVTVVLPKEGTEPLGVRVDGFRLPRALGTKLEAGALKVTRHGADQGGGGASDAAPDRARWTLAGDLTVAGYPLHLDGDVTAQICDK